MTALTSPSGRLSFSPQGTIRALSWPLATLVLVSHVAWGDAGWPVEALACAGVLGGATLIACAHVRPYTFPIIQIILFRYYLAMGLPVFSSSRLYTAAFGVLPISSRAKIEASAAGLMFATALVAAAFLSARASRRLGPRVAKALDPPRYDEKDTVAARCIACLSLLSFVLVAAQDGRMHQLPHSVGYIAAVLGNYEITLGLLFWDAYKTRSLSSKVWCSVPLLTYTLGGLSLGLVGTIVLPWIGAGLLVWALYGRLPWMLLAVLTVVVLVLNPAKHTYRQLSWRQTHDVGLLERAENWGTALATFYSGFSESSTEASAHAAETVGSRMATLVDVSHMFNWIPGRVPFAGPDGWLKVPLFYIPTIIWPERPNPTREFNAKYAITFGIHTAAMTRTATMTPPSVGDGYWRLGWPGVAMEGAILGLIVGFFHGLASPTSRSLLIIGLGYVVSGGGPESCVIASVSVLLKYIFVLTCVLLLAQWLPNVLGRGGRARGRTLPPGASGLLPPEPPAPVR